MELIDKVIKFSGKSVPLKLAAKVMRKDYQFVKYGIVEGHIITEEEIDEYNHSNK